MDSEIWIQLIILIVLLMLSAFFSSAETALTCVNPVRLKGLADEGSKRAINTLKILDNPGKMLSTILIGNNIVNISTTSLATTLTIKVFGSVYVGLATGILTLAVLLFGEIIPKTSANLNAEKLALSYSFWILKLMYILTPVIFLIDKLSGFFLKLFGIDKNKSGSGMTETELKTYVDVSHEEGVIETEEREMILNVFDLGDSLARDIMIPRIDMTMIDVNASYRNLQALFKETMYSRIPVYENDRDNIIGVVMLKDLFLVSKKTDFSIRSIMREAYYTYETKKTDDLLSEMRENATSVTIVLDEYGASVGLITLEDLLEEIVGEIRDEYDEEEKELIQELDERVYLIDGSVKIDDVNDALGTFYESEDYDSIAGLIIEAIDRLPFKGETVTLQDGTILTAESIDKNRISQVRLTLPEPADTVSQDEKASEYTENKENDERPDAVEASENETASLQEDSDVSTVSSDTVFSVDGTVSDNKTEIRHTN